MSQRLRSLNPERIRSQRLLALQDLLPSLTEEELSIARALVTHELARRAGFCDESSRREDDRWLRGLLDIDEANLRCVEKTGRRLRTADDYRVHRVPGSRSVSWLAKVFGSWGSAAAEAGLLAVGQPETDLTLQPGSPAKSRGWTSDECVAAVALVFERFRGRRFSSGAYDRAREAMGIELPTFDMVRRSLVGGKSQGAWNRIRAAAIELVLAKPARYPKAYAYLTRTEGVG